jgi:MFS family permease
VRRRGLAAPPAHLLVYFGALGVGFMLVEIPTIQRLTVYLGRPVYSLAVVLFALLLFSGLGSFWVGRRREISPPRGLFSALVVLAVFHALAAPWVLDRTIGWPLAARMAMTVVLLAPLGFLMGMPFPAGVRIAGSQYPGVIPWLWGINGVTSVMGSALSVALAIHIGLQATLLIAAGCYALAGGMLWREEL